jgi:hypothetical protein
MCLRLALASAALLAASQAVAQEGAAVSHAIEAAYTWSAVDLSSMAFGEGQIAYSTETYVVVSDRDGPLAGLAGRCLVAGTADMASGGYQYAGACVYQDADGHQLWARNQSAFAGGEAPTTSRAIWTGGTGRFEGATGEVTYGETSYVAAGPGVSQGTATLAGTLILPGG